MKIVAISDTHFNENNIKIPNCDILICAGDYDIRTINHLEQLNWWFATLPASYIIFIGGNHDVYLERIKKEMVKKVVNNAIYLENETITIEGIKIWGSPYSLPFNDWAFMKEEKELEKIYSKIPKDVDIILTHTPPYGILDLTEIGNHHIGSFSLLNRIKEIKPKYNIFGHCHEGYGKYTDYTTDFINASQVTSTYKLENKPIELEI